jgi:hypothetical protein
MGHTGQRNKGNVREQKRRYALKYRERELERNRLKSTAYRRRLGIKPRRVGRKPVERVVIPKPTPEERFWAKVDKDAACSHWLWTARVSTHGYGGLLVNGKVVPAHRFAYALFNGPIPKGRHVHHKCGNKLCVNPAHLELLTASEHQAGHWRERKRAIEHYEIFRKQEARKMVDSLRLLGARLK